MWRSLVEDQNGRRMLPKFIMTMDPDVVEAIICNNLAYKQLTDGEFREKTSGGTTPRNTPGVYYNQFVDSGSVRHGSQPNVHRAGDVGKGFSVEILRQIVHHVENCLKTGLSAQQLSEYVKEIDCHFQTSNTDGIDYDLEPDARRYAQNKDRRKIIEEWMAAVKVNVLDLSSQLPAERKKQQWPWNLTHTGIDINTGDKVQQNIFSDSAGALLGLINSIVGKHFPQFELHQRQLILITDIADCVLAEAFLGVLASSFHCNGGFNADLADGTSYASRSHQASDIGSQENADCLFTRDDFNELKAPVRYGIQHQKDKTKRLHRWIEARSQGDSQTHMRAVKESVEAANLEVESMRRFYDFLKVRKLVEELDKSLLKAQSSTVGKRGEIGE